MFKRSILSLIFLIVSLFAVSQNYIAFKGRILDKQTNQPLSFVSIGILTKGIGVISNEYGEFLLQIPSDLQNDTVIISCLGYDKIKKAIANIQSGELNVLKIAPNSMSIQEVTILGSKINLKIKNIVKKAIKKIPDNYPAEPFQLSGYYRDYMKEENNIYQNLFEAALIIEDKGFNTRDFANTSVKMVQLRINPDCLFDPTKIASYSQQNKYIPYATLRGENEFSLLRAHDPIRNHIIMPSFIDFLDQNFIKTHNFTLENILYLDSVPVYKIKLKYIINNSDFTFWVNGYIYTNARTFAIHKLSYSIICKTPEYWGKILDLNLEYKEYGDKMYLNYLSLMNYFELVNIIKAGNKSIPVTKRIFQYREFFVNKIQLSPFTKLSPTELMNKGISLFKNNVPQQPGFWETYNYVSHLPLLK